MSGRPSAVFGRRALGVISRHSDSHGRSRDTVNDILQDLGAGPCLARDNRRDFVREDSRQELEQLVLALDDVGQLKEQVSA
jgi:hypothetical protein